MSKLFLPAAAPHTHSHLLVSFVSICEKQSEKPTVYHKKMASREAVRRTLQQVRPILSVDQNEARRRVLSLYRAWYRQAPYIGEYERRPPHHNNAICVISSLRALCVCVSICAKKKHGQYFIISLNTVMDYDIPKSIDQIRSKIREQFAKNQSVTDIRVIDMLVIKSQMELKETVEIWKQKGHVMRYWKESEEPKPTDFLSKFIAGNN